MGGSVQCIPFIRAEVEESAWGYEERYRQKQDIVVGQRVRDRAGRRSRDPPGRPEAERQQVERLKAFKEDRDPDAVQGGLEDCAACGALKACSSRCGPPSRTAGSLGEVSGVMREEFGEYSEA